MKKLFVILVSLIGFVISANAQHSDPKVMQQKVNEANSQTKANDGNKDNYSPYKDRTECVKVEDNKMGAALNMVGSGTTPIQSAIISRGTANLKCDEIVKDNAEKAKQETKKE